MGGASTMLVGRIQSNNSKCKLGLFHCLPGGQTIPTSICSVGYMSPDIINDLEASTLFRDACVQNNSHSSDEDSNTKYIKELVRKTCEIVLHKQQSIDTNGKDL